MLCVIGKEKWPGEMNMSPGAYDKARTTQDKDLVTKLAAWHCLIIVSFLFFLLFIVFPRRKKKNVILNQIHDPVWQLRTKHSSSLVEPEKTRRARKAILQSVLYATSMYWLFRAGNENQGLRHARKSSTIESSHQLLLFISNMNSVSPLNQTQF